jgi:hypothetical protein
VSGASTPKRGDRVRYVGASRFVGKRGRPLRELNLIGVVQSVTPLRVVVRMEGIARPMRYLAKNLEVIRA